MANYEHLGIITITNTIFDSDDYIDIGSDVINIKMFDTLGIEILAVYRDLVNCDYHIVCICDKFEIVNKWNLIPTHLIGIKVDYYKNVSYSLYSDSLVRDVFNPKQILKGI